MVNISATIPDNVNAMGYPTRPLLFELAEATKGPCDVTRFHRTITVTILEGRESIAAQFLRDKGLILPE